jgi:hypothetical protein
MNKRKTTKRSDQRRIEQTLIRQKPKPAEPANPQNEKRERPGEPAARRPINWQTLKEWGWVDETSEHLGETITIIGAPPSGKK